MISRGQPILIYGFVFCFLGALAIAASLAEMASFTPTLLVISLGIHAGAEGHVSLHVVAYRLTRTHWLVCDFIASLSHFLTYKLVTQILPLECSSPAPCSKVSLCKTTQTTTTNAGTVHYLLGLLFFAASLSTRCWGGCFRRSHVRWTLQ